MLGLQHLTSLTNTSGSGEDDEDEGGAAAEMLLPTGFVTGGGGGTGAGGGSGGVNLSLHSSSAIAHPAEVFVSFTQSECDALLGTLLSHADALVSCVPGFSSFDAAFSRARTFASRETLSRMQMEAATAYTCGVVLCSALLQDALRCRFAAAVLLAPLQAGAVAATSVYSAAGVLSRLDDCCTRIAARASELQGAIHSAAQESVWNCQATQQWRAYATWARLHLHTAVLHEVQALAPLLRSVADAVQHCASVTAMPHHEAAAVAAGGVLHAALGDVQHGWPPAALAPAVQREVLGTLTAARGCTNDSAMPFVLVEFARAHEACGDTSSARKLYAEAMDLINAPATATTATATAAATGAAGGTAAAAAATAAAAASARSARSAANNWKVWNSAALCELRAAGSTSASSASSASTSAGVGAALDICERALTSSPASGRLWALAAAIQAQCSARELLQVMGTAPSVPQGASATAARVSSAWTQLTDCAPFTPAATATATLAAAASVAPTSLSSDAAVRALLCAKVICAALQHVKKSGEVWIAAAAIHADPGCPAFNLQAADACLQKAAAYTRQCGDVFVEQQRIALVRAMLTAATSTSTGIGTGTAASVADARRVYSALCREDTSAITAAAVAAEPHYGAAWVSAMSWPLFEGRDSAREILARHRRVLRRQLVIPRVAAALLRAAGAEAAAALVAAADADADAHAADADAAVGAGSGAAEEQVYEAGEAGPPQPTRVLLQLQALYGGDVML